MIRAIIKFSQVPIDIVLRYPFTIKRHFAGVALLHSPQKFFYQKFHSVKKSESVKMFSFRVSRATLKFFPVPFISRRSEITIVETRFRGKERREQKSRQNFPGIGKFMVSRNGSCDYENHARSYIQAFYVHVSTLSFRRSISRDSQNSLNVVRIFVVSVHFR